MNTRLHLLYITHIPHIVHRGRLPDAEAWTVAALTHCSHCSHCAASFDTLFTLCRRRLPDAEAWTAAPTARARAAAPTARVGRGAGAAALCSLLSVSSFGGGVELARAVASPAGTQWSSRWRHSVHASASGSRRRHSVEAGGRQSSAAPQLFGSARCTKSSAASLATPRALDLRIKFLLTSALRHVDAIIFSFFLLFIYVIISVYENP